MQILFNELSLIGQFSDQDVFIRDGLLPFVGVMKEMEKFSIELQKKNDAWNYNITPFSTLYSFIIDSKFRKSDEVTRLKSAFVNLIKEPFWDSNIKQNPDFTYSFDKTDIWGSSPAEACERDKIIVSFVFSATSLDPLNITRNGINIPLLNLTSVGQLTEYLWDNNKISFESYLKVRFSGGKLDFSNVNVKMDFSGIQTTEQTLFVDTFRRFEELTWDNIYEDKGLDYKEYHGSINVRYRDIKTYKFRASQKIRCHGYRVNNSFIVIGFELDHKLSDQG